MTDNAPKNRRIRGLPLIGWATLLTIGSAASAQLQRLSDRKLTGQSVDNGVITLHSDGSAALQICFLTTSTARIRVAPDGNFDRNPSPSVAGEPQPLADTRVADHGDYLLIQNSGLSLRVAKDHLRVDAYDAKNQLPISLESVDHGTVWDTQSGAISSGRNLAAAEHIYGLGEDNANHGMLDRRGSQREMWTGQQIRSGNVTASYPVPFYLSTGIDGRGYGCFVNNVWHLNFDLGRTRKDELSWTAPGGPIDYYFFNGPSFKEIIDQYTRLTGRPSMLPLWAFGFWQSRCFFDSFADINNSATHLQKDRLPLDVVVVDSAWSKADMDFQWSEHFQSDGRSAASWIKEFHDRGLKVIVSTKGPMIKPDADNYPGALKLGLFATDGHGQPMVAGYYGGHLLDVTNPNYAPWLITQLKPLTKYGTDGWWLDLNEPEGEPPQAVYATGKSADTHNRFSTINNKAYYDYERDDAKHDRPVILGRAATAGTQRYSGLVWTGDINSDWPTFRAHVPELQNTGLSGLPYWTNDSGGFISGYLNNDRFGAHASLYERWFEFTCFAPIARAHKAGRSEPYEFGPAVEATAKKYLELRYKLLPYLYTLAHEASTTGLPIDRPLVLEYQSDPGSATARNEFLFGPDILVAPVIYAGATTRQVYFPPGTWISIEDGFQFEGGKTTAVAAPHDRLPLFIRAGAILPEAPPMVSTGEKPWDPVALDIWPHQASSSVLYEDDFISNAYETGACTTTLFECAEEPAKSVTLRVTPSNNLFGPRQWIAKFHLTSAPTSIAIDGKAMTEKVLDWSKGDGILTVPFTAGHVAHTVKIALDGSTHPRPAAPKIDAPTSEPADEIEPPKQLAQFLPPPKLPIQIEAANYDKGGEGLAFHIQNPVADAIYRKDGVPIITSDDGGGGYAIKGLAAGDWLAYSIDAGDGGMFSVSTRVKAAGKAGMRLFADRNKDLTNVTIPTDASGWTDVKGSNAFYLGGGVQIITVEVTDPGFEISHLTFNSLKKEVISQDDFDFFKPRTSLAGFKQALIPTAAAQSSRRTSKRLLREHLARFRDFVASSF